MANSFRYFNLSGLSGLGQYNGLGVSWNAKKTVDLTSSALSNWGSIASAGDDFPNVGAGLEHTVLLGASFSLGGLGTTTNTSEDFGSIA